MSPLPYNFSNKFRRTLAILALVLTIFGSAGAGLFTPRPANAQFTDFANLVINSAQWVYDSVLAPAAKWAWDHGAAVAFKNAAKTFTQQIAYNTAVKITSSGSGQTPLIQTKSFGQLMSDAADDAAGDMLDTLGKENGFLKLDLCQPSNNFFNLDIALPSFLLDGRSPESQRRGKCKLSDLKKNWGAILNDPKKQKQFLKQFTATLDPKQNDLGVSISVQQSFIKDKETAARLASAQEQVNKGVKGVTEKITGAIKTPATFVGEQFSATNIQGPLKDALVFTGDVLSDAIGVFTQTLASRMLKNLLDPQKGLVPNPSRSKSNVFGPPGGGGVEYAVQMQSSISTPQLLGSEKLDVISELSNCPEDASLAQPLNCTIDGKFEQILRQAESGTPLTVKEAIDKGFLNDGWVFKNELRPTSQRTPDNWYVSDLRKLRRARVIPVGWELAAEVTGNNSLKSAIAGFND